MRMTTGLMALLAFGAAAPALAQQALSQPACPLPYAAFEAAVPHIDLETCPASVKREKAICRLTINQGQLHLFVFAEEGDQCLVSARTLEADDYRLNVR